jgi:hypothetical protein
MVVYDGLDPVHQQVDPLVQNLPVNPTTRQQLADGSDRPTGESGLSTALTRQYISNPSSRMLADLSNQRYRMLVTNLAHAHIVAAAPDATVRATGGYLMQRSFADMFNVKTLAGQLFRSPLTSQAGDPRRAGPPFDLPDSLDISGRTDKQLWQLQLTLAQTSMKLCMQLLEGPDAPPGGSERYLRTLLDLDQNDIARINVIIKATPDEESGSTA